MSEQSQWVSPFLKQGFVTLGASLNVMNNGFTIAFSAVLLPQLRKTQFLEIDETSASWIASILGTSLILGTLMVSSIMLIIGRKFTNLTSSTVMALGWIIVITSTSYYSLLIGRFIQGISVGFTTIVASILIGEYTSPKYRGLFLGTISSSVFTGVLIAHFLGSVISWQKTAIFGCFLAVLTMVIIVYSPESPSFLVSRGKYEECRKSFHWLRGLNEEEELEKMIKTEMKKTTQHGQSKSKNFVSQFVTNFVIIVKTIKKKEFHKPIILMLHLYTLNEWAGSSLHDCYAIDIYHKIIGPQVDVPLMITSTDLQRMVSCISVIIIISKVRRRVITLITVSLNIIAYLTVAGYSYAKFHNILYYDHPLIGVVFIHFHMFSAAIANVPCNIISGEVFPLAYRGITSTICLLFFSCNFFINIKIAPYLFSSIGLHGMYCISAGIISYCLVVVMIMLPETKDRTLQDIEEEFNPKLIRNDQIISFQCDELEQDV